MATAHYDFIIVGSGFGGSVSALRLTEKGYRVLVVEKGLRFGREDFPKTNMEFKKWYWMPAIGAQGIFQMSFFDHVTVLHGVGVGGGSLVYCCTHPTPKDGFFEAPSWSHLADWKRELGPHYATASRMLGATEPNPSEKVGDRIVREIAADIGREAHYEKTRVAIFFGEPGKEVPDPYFGGEGPSRAGCTECGACGTGCRVGAKNTLDLNYLYLAERRGCEVLPETEVQAVREANGGTQGRYVVETKCSTRAGGQRRFTADNVVFAGGVLGTVPLLLALKDDPGGLPRLSPRVGDFVRTNSESIIGVCAEDDAVDYSKGISISSIVHTDEDSHFEIVRNGAGSNFQNFLGVPHAPGDTLLARVVETGRFLLKHPRRYWKVGRAKDAAAQTTIMLYMKTLEGSISLRLGRSVMNGFRKGLVTKLAKGQPKPLAFLPEATDIAWRFAEKVRGLPLGTITETLSATPTTAHILGGACMGKNAAEGVIDHKHEVHGYPGLYVVDGAAVSANPGVNPSLTIAALAERAMSYIPAKAASA